MKPGTGAAKAGIKGGTHKVTVSGRALHTRRRHHCGRERDECRQLGGKLEDIIAGRKPGDKISLEIYRGNKKMTVSVTLGNR